MSRAISKAALKELIKNAQTFCDHPKGEHEKGHCDFLVISQGQLSELLEDAQ